MKNILKFNFLTGKKTYIAGGLMMIHSTIQVIMDLLNSKVPDQLTIMEFVNGFGIIGLRKAIL